MNRPKFDWQDIQASLETLPATRLANLLLRTSDTNDPLRRSIYIWVALVKYADDTQRLAKVIKDAMNLTDHRIPYDESASYCQVVHSVHDVIDELARTGRIDTAVKMCQLAIETGAASGETLQDGDFWDMAVDDLRELMEKLTA